MNLSQLTDLQRQSVLDLALLAMYADGHLASSEDERVHRLLAALGDKTEHERNALYDAAVSRVRQHAETAAGVRAHAATLAKGFAAGRGPEILQLLEEVLASDQRMAACERVFLNELKKALAV